MPARGEDRLTLRCPAGPPRSAAARSTARARRRPDRAREPRAARPPPGAAIVLTAPHPVQVDRGGAHDPVACGGARPGDHHALGAQAHEAGRSGGGGEAVGVGEALEQLGGAEAHAGGGAVDVDARLAPALVGPGDDRAVVVAEQRGDPQVRADRRRAAGSGARRPWRAGRGRRSRRPGPTRRARRCGSPWRASSACTGPAPAALGGTLRTKPCAK